VPTAYGHRAVMIRGYVDRVEIVCGSEQIDCHRHSYAPEDFVIDPLHYLALLEPAPAAPTDRPSLAGSSNRARATLWAAAPPVKREQRSYRGCRGWRVTPTYGPCLLPTTRPDALHVKVRGVDRGAGLLPPRFIQTTGINPVKTEVVNEPEHDGLGRVVVACNRQSRATLCPSQHLHAETDKSLQVSQLAQCSQKRTITTAHAGSRSTRWHHLSNLWRGRSSMTFGLGPISGDWVTAATQDEELANGCL
jgi:hypothetical protein